ncbi:MAG: alpha/beta hydrolase [Patescibacteria group bacterium]
MKNASIFHCWAGTPEKFWYPYVKNELEKKDYSVWLPQLPDTEHPVISTQLSYVLENGKFNEDTVIIGHSSGVGLILSTLENIDIQIHHIVLVSGFITPDGKESDNMLQPSYDWEKIKKNVKHVTVVNSDNDPWGCDDVQGRKLFDKLGGTQIILHGEGHMGSDTYNQPYKEFPLIVKLIEAYEH